MKGKTLICVTLPAAKRTYDLWIPNKMPIQEALPLIKGILESKERNFFLKNPRNTFMLKESGEIVDGSQTAKELELVNGSELVLV